MSVVYTKGQIKNEKYGFPVALVGVIFLLIGIITIKGNSPLLELHSMVPCVGIALILISKDNIITRFLSTKPLVYIGKLSYSLYLWHWPIMAFQRYREGIFEGHQFDWKEIIIISLLTFVTGWFSYTFVESTTRNDSFKKILIKLGCILLPLGIATYSLHWLSQKYKIPMEYTQASFATGSHNEDSVDTLGDKRDKFPHVFLMGNSHANSLKPLFNILGKEYGFSLKTLTADSFLALKEIDKNEIPETELVFYNFSRSLVAHTRQLIDSSDVIIISSDSFIEYKSVTKALDSLAKSLKPNQKLILMNTYPIVDRNPVRINNGIVKSSNHKFKTIVNSKNLSTLDSLASVHKNIIVWDISKGSFYDDAPYYQDTLIYYDDRHLNRRGAELLAKKIEVNFKNIILPTIQKHKS